MTSIAILQSNYIPWKGYFDLIRSVDKFIIFDEMQYTRRDWRNRNRIKTPQGLLWLTVPVSCKGKYFQKISETKLSDANWAPDHWVKITQNYRRAKYFNEIRDLLEPIYFGEHFDYLSQLNLRLIQSICCYLNITTQILNSCDFTLADEKSERLAGLCRQVEATEYLTGPSAHDYLDESVFHRNGINVKFFDYSGYPVYPQLWGEFEHNVSIIDLLFNCGSSSLLYFTKK